MIWELTFSDWEHYADGDGNEHTLDWSSAGAIRGRPAYPYLEAIRQAINERFPPRMDWRPYSGADYSNTYDFEKTTPYSLLGNNGFYEEVYDPPPGGFFGWVYVAWVRFITRYLTRYEEEEDLSLETRQTGASQYKDQPEGSVPYHGILGWMAPRWVNEGTTIPSPIVATAPVMSLATLLTYVNRRYDASYDNYLWLDENHDILSPVDWEERQGVFLPRADWILQVYRILNCMTCMTPMIGYSASLDWISTECKEKDVVGNLNEGFDPVSAYNAEPWVPVGQWTCKLLGRRITLNGHPYAGVQGIKADGVIDFSAINIHDRPITVRPFGRIANDSTTYWNPAYPDNDEGDYVYNGSGSFDPETGLVSVHWTPPESIDDLPSDLGERFGCRFYMSFQLDMSQAFTFSDSRTE